MNSTRITSFVICLGLTCLMLTGSALAGTTTVVAEVNYSRETGAAAAVYTLPANTVTRAMNVVRDATEDFVMKVTLGNGFTFSSVLLPKGADLTLTTASGCVVNASTVLAGGTSGDAFVDFFVDITTACTGFPTFTLTTTQWRVNDVTNVIGAGNTATITMETRDSATNTIFDSGTDSDNWLNGIYGVSIPTAAVLAATTAVVDVAAARLTFVATSPDTTVQDNGATLGIDASIAGPLTNGATAYTLVTADSVDLVFTGTLSGITSFTWDSGGVALAHTVTAAELAAGSATLSIPGDTASLDATANGIRIIVDGTTTLSDRTLQLTVNLVLSGGVGGAAANNRVLQGATNMSVWSLNGTVLIANFMNGNTDVFNSRIYLFNTSTSAGNITVRVYTLPIAGGANTLLGTVAVGSLAPSAALNIRLAEDVLTPASITTPYTTDGGNLLVEVTIEASGVTGVGQVYESATLDSFGIYALQTAP